VTRSNDLLHPPNVRQVSWHSAKRALSDDRAFGVAEALALPATADELDVYVGWHTQSVAVSARRWAPGTMSWDAAGPLLRERVLAAVAPLHSAGWHLAGSIYAATRWDVSCGTGGDRYEGCWVRLRR
jgi:hypothetical protein